MTMSDTFDNILPLPYRVISHLVLGSWLWLLTLKISSTVGINILSLLKFDEIPNTSLNLLELITNHEKTSVNISLISFSSYIIFQLGHNKEIETISILDFLPFLTILVIFYLLLNPNQGIGSKRLLTSFQRILPGGIDQSIRTNDILLSDTLTSYSKILIDFSIYLCHLVNFETCLPKNTGSKINRHCGDSVFLESLVGILPTLIRLKQCWFEYKVSQYRNKSHLLNFFKYSTNIPILVVSLYMKIKGTDLTNWWVFFALVNSTYTFFWDVNNDWDLSLFKKFTSTDSKNSGILRFKLHYNFKLFYYLAIFSDFLFRYIWVLKFLPSSTETSSIVYIFLSSLYSTEFGLYSLQFIELIRRWIWVFIKVEVDYINLNSLDIPQVNQQKDIPLETLK